MFFRRDCMLSPSVTHNRISERISGSERHRLRLFWLRDRLCCGSNIGEPFHASVRSNVGKLVHRRRLQWKFRKR